MVQLDTARAANVKLVSGQSVTAVFVGATTGIGEYTLRGLADTAKVNGGSGLRIYLVGRNQVAADSILGDCRKLCPEGVFVFVKAGNLALVQDVDKACREVQRLENKRGGEGAGTAKVDMLVMTQGVLQFGSRQETTEGLDTSMSLLYYSRMRFLTQLLPLLRASTLATGARCISVYAGGFEVKKQFYPDDFSLRKPEHFSFAQVRSQVTYMKTLFFENLARENKGKLACVHIYPGLVITPSFYSKSHPWWFKMAWACVAPVAKFFATSAEDIGQRVLFLATDKYAARAGTADTVPKDLAMSSDRVRGGGAYSVKVDGETNDVSAAYADFDRKEMVERVWDHTMEVFRDAESVK
ncbi:hypothetical protein LTR09_000777 [Extremus antarcticus]|uniref:Uncharacterized protein n=1 Tax=Extremus antarcticus TaxID=702011 RepID=A0AAJ0GK86_9PEZI|nr:hypothetical protein LTR09_000777 [Extremus antarcticus]